MTPYILILHFYRLKQPHIKISTEHTQTFFFTIPKQYNTTNIYKAFVLGMSNLMIQNIKVSMDGIGTPSFCRQILNDLGPWCSEGSRNQPHIETGVLGRKVDARLCSLGSGGSVVAKGTLTFYFILFHTHIFKGHSIRDMHIYALKWAFVLSFTPCLKCILRSWHRLNCVS